MTPGGLGEWVCGGMAGEGGRQECRGTGVWRGGGGGMRGVGTDVTG